MQREAGVEAEEEVLAVRRGLPHAAAREVRRREPRDPEVGAHEEPSGERVVQSPGRYPDTVPLRHPPSLLPRPAGLLPAADPGPAAA